MLPPSTPPASGGSRTAPPLPPPLHALSLKIMSLKL
uniref:Uncharacterized protein n=1 Tax=Arundo donax TaxID=35708 RepID=A0A0A9BK47_ARUDO